MSTKIYNGYRSPAAAIAASVRWFRIAIWRNVVKSASQQIITMDDARAFADHNGEAGIHIWHDPKEEVALYVLFGFPAFIEKLPKRPSWLKEYSYWNNSDEPKGMTRRRWKERERTWNRIALDGDRWDNRLTNIVLSKGYGEMALAMECIAKHRESWNMKASELLSHQPLPTRYR